MESEIKQIEHDAARRSSPVIVADQPHASDPRVKARLRGLGVFVGVLCLVFHRTLAGWVKLALNESFHSHVVLIPFAAAYLVWQRKSRLLSLRVESSPVLAALAFIMGSVPWVVVEIGDFGGADRISYLMLAFVTFVIGGAYLFLGRQWMRSILLPAAFLFFMVPLPDALTQVLERASQSASAHAADLLFFVSGLPYLRDGMNFHLSNVHLQVAQECSGIRSSLVLLITGAFASDLLLQTTWRRWFLVLVVIPLGVLRNGFRILTLGVLSVHVGPEILDSALHHRGGPIFFALSLIPLLALVWWLRRGELRKNMRLSVQGEAHQ